MTAVIMDPKINRAVFEKLSSVTKLMLEVW